jgi:hypothetical protein
MEKLVPNDRVVAVNIKRTQPSSGDYFALLA